MADREQESFKNQRKRKKIMKNYRLAVDENGSPFVLNSKGSIDFGYITEEMTCHLLLSGLLKEMKVMVLRIWSRIILINYPIVDLLTCQHSWNM